MNRSLTSLSTLSTLFVLLVFSPWSVLAYGRTQEVEAQHDATAKQNQDAASRPALRGGGVPRGNGQLRENANRRPPVEITPQRREELIAFVRENNPPIERLLKNLETKNPGQFRTALQAMAREVQSLEDLKTRDPERFQLSLELWQNRSRLDLLAAQIALQTESRRPDLRRQMQQAMVQQNELRAKLVDLELQRVTERQTRLEKSRDELRNMTDADVRRQVSDVIARNRRLLERNEKKPETENKDGG